MVVLGHLAEFFVLGDLEDPEPDRERGEGNRHDVLERRQSRREAAAIVRHLVGGHT
jgi:hypothetical protein